MKALYCYQQEAIIKKGKMCVRQEKGECVPWEMVFRGFAQTAGTSFLRSWDLVSDTLGFAIS